MTLESTINKNRYIGNGATTQFPFTFKIWKTDQILVYVGNGETEQEVSAQCTVTLTASGGTVTFPTAPTSGTIIVLRRNMPYIQEDDYRNGTRFDSEEIEDRFDQDCAERQDLRLDVDRAVKVPLTSSKTPEQYDKDFWDAYNDTVEKHSSVVWLHERVRSERPIALAAISNAKADALSGVADAKADALNSVADAESNALEVIAGAGSTQIQRIENIVPIILSDKGHSCQEANWVLDSSISSGSTIDVSPLAYVVGRHHVQVSCNGVRLYRTKQFDEVGEQFDVQSSLIKVNIDLFAGDTINVWIAGLAGTATHTSDGLLSAADKSKLDSLPSAFEFKKKTTVLDVDMLAGTSFTVPEHVVGDGRLFVFVNGVSCEVGVDRQYIEVSNTAISFNDKLFAGSVITVFTGVTEME